MIRRFTFRLLLPLCLATSAHAAAPAEQGVMRLASLDWLPYVSARLAQEGWSSFVADTAAQKFGYRAKIEYFPWTRAMQLGTRDTRYAGYFPAYHTEERTHTCHFSAPIGSSTVGLVFLKNAPVRWTTVQDLASLKIGAVAGFSNGPAIDSMVREGKMQLDVSPSDMLNLRKLLAGRVDAVVMDKLVLRYLLATEPSLEREKHRFAFHDKPLAELSLHICFQRTPEGRDMQRAFDRAMQTLPLRKLETEYFQRLEKQ